jgi:hypothetical protein
VCLCRRRRTRRRRGRGICDPRGVRGTAARLCREVARVPPSLALSLAHLRTTCEAVLGAGDRTLRTFPFGPCPLNIPAVYARFKAGELRALSFSRSLVLSKTPSSLGLPLLDFFLGLALPSHYIRLNADVEPGRGYSLAVAVPRFFCNLKLFFLFLSTVRLRDSQELPLDFQTFEPPKFILLEKTTFA